MIEMDAYSKGFPLTESITAPVRVPYADLSIDRSSMAYREVNTTERMNRVYRVIRVSVVSTVETYPYLMFHANIIKLNKVRSSNLNVCSFIVLI